MKIIDTLKAIKEILILRRNMKVIRNQVCGIKIFIVKMKNTALVGVAQWNESRPANQRVSCSISNQGTCLGCRPGPQEWMHERQPQIDVSLFPFSSLKLNE